MASSIAGSINRRCINALTYYKPLEFKRNTEYTTRGCGRGRGRAYGGSSQIISRGGSSQISLYTASQVTAQSNQLTQQYIGGIKSGENSGGSQNTILSTLLNVSSNI